MPTTRGGSGGSFLSRLTRRSSVSGLVAIPIREARREPASPPSDEPMSVWVWRSRSVVLARGAANPGSRSAKMRRGQSARGQTKRRTAMRSRTRRPRQGRSPSRRVYRLRTRRASEPQSGQAAVGAVIARWTVSCSTSRQARTRQLPSGAPSNSSGSNARLRGRSSRRVQVVTRYPFLRPCSTESAGEPLFGTLHAIAGQAVSQGSWKASSLLHRFRFLRQVAHRPDPNPACDSLDLERGADDLHPVGREHLLRLLRRRWLRVLRRVPDERLE